jgi:hypothetical protein
MANPQSENRRRYAMRPTDDSFYDTAPVRFDNRIDVPVGAAVVWHILEDAQSWTVWAGVIDAVEWTSPKPFGLGTTRTVTMAKGAMIGWERFIAWEPGRRMGFCFTEATMDGVDRFAEDWQVTPTGPASCSVRWVMCMEPRGISKYLMPLSRPLMNWNFRRYLKRLSRYAQERQNDPKFAAGPPGRHG